MLRNTHTKDYGYIVMTTLEKIIDAIYALPSDRIKEERRTQVSEFIKIAVNGDTLQEHLALEAALAKDRVGVLLYVLTNTRLIKIEIETAPQEEIKSSSFLLKNLTGYERTLEEDRASVKISFQNGSFGLKYSADSKEIDDFFQKVDHSRSTRDN
jgi:hypothetical protein